MCLNVPLFFVETFKMCFTCFLWPELIGAAFTV